MCKSERMRTMGVRKFRESDRASEREERESVRRGEREEDAYVLDGRE